MISALDVPPMRQFRCPNGLLVWNAPEAEHDTRFIYTEIFEQRCYERHGVSLRNGDVVVDVGANVGLFSLWVLDRLEDVRLVCVEPVPQIRACLERNLAEHRSGSNTTCTVLPHALGATSGVAEISYYPQQPGNSTLYPGAKRDEWATIVNRITFSQLWKVNKRLAMLSLITFPWRQQVFERFVAPAFDAGVRVRCDVCTLSDVIRAQQLDRVDLLKVDVEGAELGVLDGIDEDHWPLIRQIVLEISPANKSHLEPLTERLRGRGLSAIAVESMLGTPVMDDPLPCTLYAVRR